MAAITHLKTRDIRISNCIVSFPKLLTAEVTKNGAGKVINATPRFTAKFIAPALDQADMQLLVQRYQQAVLEGNPTGMPEGWAWDQQTGFVTGVQTNYHCFKAPESQFPGQLVFAGAASEKSPPTVVDQNRVRMTPDRQSELFAGCIVTVVGHFYAYDQGTPGISFSIDVVQLKDNNVTRLDNKIGVDDALDGDDEAPGGGGQMSTGAPVPGLNAAGGPPPSDNYVPPAGGGFVPPGDATNFLV